MGERLYTPGPKSMSTTKSSCYLSCFPEPQISNYRLTRSPDNSGMTTRNMTLVGSVMLILEVEAVEEWYELPVETSEIGESLEDDESVSERNSEGDWLRVMVR